MTELDKMLERLPKHLQERTRLPSRKSGSAQPTGAFVLYWMRTALRVAENPALDVARLWADQLSLPLLVYHGLDERYEFASDRHHRFILEGARDVQAELEAAGISYAFHLARPGKREPHLVQLAR
ncbi:MAG: deoxyribodipyrimidine photo-lyase, partial [Planctomycetota bacterium]